MAEQQSRFSPGLSQAELAAGYKKVGAAPKFTKADLTKAYQPYAKYGIKVNQLRAKKTDAQLYEVAAQAVILRHKDSVKAAAAAKAPAKPSPKPAARPATSTARPATAAPRAAAPKTTVLSAARTAQLLSWAGFAGSKPPPYALTSEAQLAAWIKRAQAYATARTAAKKKAAAATVTQQARHVSIVKQHAATGTKTYSPGKFVPI